MVPVMEGRKGELPDAPLSAPAARTTPDGLDERSVSRRVDQLRLRARDAVPYAARSFQPGRIALHLQQMHVAQADNAPYGLSSPAHLAHCWPCAFARFLRRWHIFARAQRRGSSYTLSLAPTDARRPLHPAECQRALPVAAYMQSTMTKSRRALHCTTTSASGAVAVALASRTAALPPCAGFPWPLSGSPPFPTPALRTL